MSDWKVFIEYRPSVLGTFIYVSKRIDEYKTQFLVKGGDEIKTIDTTSAEPDEVYFARLEDEHIASLIIEAFDKRGIKAPSQSYTEGKLEATTEHLQDLRKLIPKLNQGGNK